MPDQCSLTLVSCCFFFFPLYFFNLLTFLGEGIEIALKARGLFPSKTAVGQKVMVVGTAPTGAPGVLLESQIMVPLKSVAKSP